MSSTQENQWQINESAKSNKNHLPHPGSSQITSGERANLGMKPADVDGFWMILLDSGTVWQPHCTTCMINLLTNVYTVYGNTFWLIHISLWIYESVSREPIHSWKHSDTCFCRGMLPRLLGAITTVPKGVWTGDLCPHLSYRTADLESRPYDDDDDDDDDDLCHAKVSYVHNTPM